MSEVQQPRRLTLKKRQTKFEIEQEDGSVQVYTVREFDGTGRDEYFELLSNKVDVDMTKKTGKITKFGGLYTDLLSKTVYDPEGKLVSAEVIAKWPSSAQEELFKEAQELCGLNKEAEDTVKKPLSENGSAGSSLPNNSTSPSKNASNEILPLSS